MGSNLRIISGSFDRVLKSGSTCEHTRESIWHNDSFYTCLLRRHIYKENMSQVKGLPLNWVNFNKRSYEKIKLLSLPEPTALVHALHAIWLTKTTLAHALIVSTWPSWPGSESKRVYMEKRRVALAVVVVNMPRGFNIRNRIYYFSGWTAMKPSCWSTKGASVTVLTSGGLKTIDSVGRTPSMEWWLHYTVLPSTPVCMGTNSAWGCILTV